MNVFVVAETLGKSVGELLNEMSTDEFAYWLSYFKLKAEHIERMQKQQQRR